MEITKTGTTLDFLLEKRYVRLVPERAGDPLELQYVLLTNEGLKRAFDLVWDDLELRDNGHCSDDGAMRLLLYRARWWEHFHPVNDDESSENALLAYLLHRHLKHMLEPFKIQ